MSEVIIVLTLIIVLLLCVIMWNNQQNEATMNKALEGMWVASNDFCNRSGIGSMLLYIGPVAKVTSAYIIVLSKDTLILDERIDLHIKEFPILIQSQEVNKSLEIESESLEEMMPRYQQLILNIGEGKMTWKGIGEPTVYAEFYKDAISVANSI